MRFQILDVGHGFCAILIAENGNTMMFDCGHKPTPEFRPSTYLWQLGQSSIERLFISNYDEDHISDLPEVCRLFSIRIFHRNRSITTSQLHELKKQSGYLSSSMTTLLDLNDSYVYSEPVPPPEFSGVEYITFHNRYQLDFEDTNNISLVTFLNCNGTQFVLPGDLGYEGWERLLQDESFNNVLQNVDYFVASHHGRKDGYCEAVFEYCNPRAVIFSDGPVTHSTQEMANTYGKHASGIQFNGVTRKVLSTRRDGTLTWDL